MSACSSPIASCAESEYDIGKLPEKPSTSYAGGKLNGTKIGVPYAETAQWLLVTTDSGVVVVSPTAAGVTVEKTPTANGSDEYVVTFTDVAVADDDVLAPLTVQPTRPDRGPVDGSTHVRCKPCHHQTPFCAAKPAVVRIGLSTPSRPPWRGTGR